MRTGFAFTLSSLVFGVACGGGGGNGDTPTPDAAVDIGFNKPTATLKANISTGEDMWMEAGAADLSCLNTPAADVATTVDVALTTKVIDFQSENPLANVEVTAFPDQNIQAPFVGSPYTSDQNALVTIAIPKGTKRFGYKMRSGTQLDTLLVNQTVAPDVATQTAADVRSVSKVTAQALTSFIGVSRTPGTGVLAGAIRDCQNREISNFIATVSTTSGSVTHAPGADTYYFSAAVGLPVRHSAEGGRQGNANGLFMIIELQPASQAYVQVWGYVTDADLNAGNLSLIAELPVPVIADTVITGSYEPLRN